MKQIEYFYNAMYYFFYRATIRFANFVTKPIFFIYSYIYKIPKIKKRFLNKGIDDPLEWHKQKYKNELLENPSLSYGTMIGHGLATSIIFFIYFGVYHIIRNLLFPTYGDEALYTFIIFGILAYVTDVIFTQIDDKDVKYIKEFNEKKGWWRIKWSIITIFTFLVSLWFVISTSDYGAIGQYLLSLSGNYTYPNNP
ncbi:MAG: hypothetical protein WC179_09045 [Candidatus Cloacimonadaceae bacterium]|jgi:hypothetical protein